MKKKIVVAICGASGSIYGIRLLKALLNMPTEVFLSVSAAGKKVMVHETAYTGGSPEAFLKSEGIVPHPEARLRVYEPDDLFAPPASGSFRHHGMIIAPCSMKTLGAIAAGIADDLIHRAADVCLKERRPLVLLTRETPLSLIHLENMQKAVRAGATIMPPCPGFYTRPRTLADIVDGTVTRALDQLGIETDLIRRWGDKDLV
ncbi:aromatic acid decarboxylase [Desulfonema ishimotonii]|uniref:Flavin prenyltransferase UbiX n=1 Tax=Desulfonema ishimotonii TaxID=45657 RepID=A0A401G3Z9_9BACT|nr:UbiX family flavin prenyltransferase [Desulfonema ishimotonii]GBC63911.1 aromatic acid decarboxylase [Desulfonema ishimotonii]